MTTDIPDFETLIQAHEYSLNRFADLKSFGTKINGKYEWITYREFGNMVSNIRAGLAQLGIEENDCVAIISDNSVEWAACAYATYGRLAHYTPMYEKQLAKDWEFIIRNSEAKLVFVANNHIYDIVSQWIDDIDSLQHIIIIQAPEEAPNSLKALIKKGADHPIPNPTNLTKDHLAALIYTSGTTGDPKGVMLTHGNICSNLNCADSVLDIPPETRSLAFLPWAHVFGQTLEVHVMLSRGGSVGLVESVETIIDNLSEVQPDLLFSVPRIFNRIYAKVLKSVESGPAFKRKLFNQAIENAEKMRLEIEKYGEASTFTKLKDKFYDKLVFSKIRAKFGSKLKYCFCGGAALSPEVSHFIDFLKITIYEGYGLTETSPLCSCNRPYYRKVGSVGIPIPNTNVEIITLPVEGYEEPNVGEICVRGENVMLGYYKLPDKTKEVIDDDGWFHTGDLGRIDKDGYLWVIGRVKEQYKLENGKYVVPVPLEERLQLSNYINQAIIEGSNRRYNIAIFVLDMEEVGNWAAQNGVTVDKTIFQNDKLHELIKGEVEELSAPFKGYERPRKWILTDKELTTENGLLTPTLKIKRRNVMRLWQNEIEALYKSKD